MKVHEKLRRAGNWTQGAYARQRGGYPVNERSEDACKWCLLGAIYATASDEKSCADAISRIARRVGKDEYEGNIVVWNDAPGRTFAEVRQVLLELDI